MPKPIRPFLLDANIFIQAKNESYGFDIAPGFWDALDDEAAAGTIVSPMEVYAEITEGDDLLAEWAKERKDSGLFIEPDAKTQKAFRAIADYVNDTYLTSHAELFLSKADPWVVAHGKAGRYTVVTHETIRKRKGKVKLPKICDHFHVVVASPYEMMKALKVSLVLEKKKSRWR